MRILGVITARGGSKRLPNKNIAILGGKPLIAWSIEIGLATCTKLVTTTDSAEIAAVARQYGSDVVMRPEELSRDDTPSLPVVVHAVKNADDGPYELVLLLQPTSPFRNEQDVVEALKVMEDTGADCVVSMVKKSDDNSYALGHANRIRAQSSTDARYAMNGSIYLIRTDYLLAGGDFDGPHCYAYMMPPERSIDIDTHSDFEATKAMLETGAFVSGANKKETAPL